MGLMDGDGLERVHEWDQTSSYNFVGKRRCADG